MLKEKDQELYFKLVRIQENTLFSFVFPPKSQVPDMSHRNRPGARGLPIARGNRGGKTLRLVFVINDVFLLFPRT